MSWQASHLAPHGLSILFRYVFSATLLTRYTPSSYLRFEPITKTWRAAVSGKPPRLHHLAPEEGLQRQRERIDAVRAKRLTTEIHASTQKVIVSHPLLLRSERYTAAAGQWQQGSKVFRADRMSKFGLDLWCAVFNNWEYQLQDAMNSCYHLAVSRSHSTFLRPKYIQRASRDASRYSFGNSISTTVFTPQTEIELIDRLKQLQSAESNTYMYYVSLLQSAEIERSASPAAGCLCSQIEPVDYSSPNHLAGRVLPLPPLHTGTCTENFHIHVPKMYMLYPCIPARASCD